MGMHVEFVDAPEHFFHRFTHHQLFAGEQCDHRVRRNNELNQVGVYYQRPVVQTSELNH